MTEYDCKKCEGRPCNIKGKPSVTQGSAYCDSHRKEQPIIRTGWLKGVRDFLTMKSIQKDEKTGMTGYKPVRGFRLDWLWRQ